MLLIGIFGGHRGEQRVDLLVVILAGVVAVVVWALGAAVIGYRLLVVAESRARGPRWAIGIPALIVWTCGVIFLTDWILG